MCFLLNHYSTKKQKVKPFKHPLIKYLIKDLIKEIREQIRSYNDMKGVSGIQNVLFCLTIIKLNGMVQ